MMRINFNNEFSILIVDDESTWLKTVSRTLSFYGGFSNIIPCDQSKDVMGIMQKEDVGVVLLDLTMPEISGEQLLEKIMLAYPDMTVIILSGLNQADAAMRCVRLGAYDYVVKTETEDRIVESVRRAVEMVGLHRENSTLRNHFFSSNAEISDVFAPIVTRSQSMLNIFRYIEAIKQTRQPILILGESGVGKELFAQAIHKLSEAKGELVSVNIAGLDDNIFADTLFGHVRGAFTGADKKRAGVIQTAEDGTLFLDEIGDLSLVNQVKLLRLLQEGEYFPVGSDAPSYSKARIVCATHQNLEKKVSEGGFRKDLYYRLRTHHISIPPLRDRPADFGLLLEHFSILAAEEFEKPIPAIPRELELHLATYSFPGNVRELRGIIFDAVGRHAGGPLSINLFSQIQSNITDLNILTDMLNPFGSLAKLPTLSEASEMLVDTALERSGGNQTLAARLLGITQPSLSKRLKKRRDNTL
jgi:DNA-binding NtrC family response regulator